MSTGKEGGEWEAKAHVLCVIGIVVSMMALLGIRLKDMPSVGSLLSGSGVSAIEASASATSSERK